MWLGHVLRHKLLLQRLYDDALYKSMFYLLTYLLTTEGRMAGKVTRGRKRMHLLSDRMENRRCMGVK